MTAILEDPRSLLDTNIIIYAHDPSDLAKHAVAEELLKRLAKQKRLVLSSQVFNEFCSVMMRPNRITRLAADQVSLLLRDLAAISEVLPITPSLTFRALEGMPRHGLSFWDALIWAAAAENGVSVLYTEDFQHGRDVEGVRFVDPFVEAPSA
ncbi:PIN domain-containing protein [Tundrisphaera lichenicola]|uniref:PIN domain-containing protein n=1 Tax=Tundrisphaera lichenicola TaxID=2029860 RepID=UPI003EBB4E7B